MDNDLLCLHRFSPYHAFFQSNRLYKLYPYVVRKAYEGLPAPDGDVVELSSGETKSLLSFGKLGRPLILNFGSYTLNAIFVLNTIVVIGINQTKI